MKTWNNKQSHINGSYGKIVLNSLNDGIVLTQTRNDGTTGAIALGSEDVEKLAKALFSKRQQRQTPSPLTPMSRFSMPASQAPPKPSYMEQEKTKHSKAYAPWTTEEENRLKEEFTSGKSITEMMDLHDRGKGAIESRLKKLGLI